MPKLYLTIDDGPSVHFEALVDFLFDHKVPAVFFNRGDHMEARPGAVIYGIKKGYVMANHGYAHQKASQMRYEAVCADILKCEVVLDRLYQQAGVERPGKYIRFPYMDRGMGPALVEDVPEVFKEPIKELITVGLGHAQRAPSDDEVDHKDQLQDFLQEQGFEPLPTPDVTLPWYVETGMAKSIDSLCTFSTSDWVLNERHLGRFGINGIDDLKRRIDADPYLHEDGTNHIVLAHDGPEIHEVLKELVKYFLDSGFEFLDF